MVELVDKSAHACSVFCLMNSACNVHDCPHCTNLFMSYHCCFDFSTHCLHVLQNNVDCRLDSRQYCIDNVISCLNNSDWSGEFHISSDDCYANELCDCSNVSLHVETGSTLLSNIPEI